MAIFAYHRTSKDNLVSLQKSLQEGSWGAIDAKTYESAPSLLSAPILSVLKLRLLQKSLILAAIEGSSTDLLSTHDGRWDNAQKRFFLKISIAETEDESTIKEAAARVRKALTLGDGLAQTKLGYDEEVAYGEKQVLLARASKDPGSKDPSLAEDIAAINAEANIKEIEERTAEFKKVIKQTLGGADVTGRAARRKVASLDCITELNDAHRELEKHLNATTSAEIKAQIQKLQDELLAAVPQNEPAHKPSPVIPVTPKE
jgi:hypothetical protein